MLISFFASNDSRKYYSCNWQGSALYSDWQLALLMQVEEDGKTVKKIRHAEDLHDHLRYFDGL
jgi:hypothetical protein